MSVGLATEHAVQLPISINRLAPAVKPNGGEVHVTDKSQLRGGNVYLLKDTPDNSHVVIVMDDELGARELAQFKVSNDGKSIVLTDETLPIIKTILDEKMPMGRKPDRSIETGGDGLNWDTIPDHTYGIALNMPTGKNITGGVTVVFTPKTLNNYKKSLGFR